jgi:thiol:disulfide interchange protein DsbA
VKIRLLLTLAALTLAACGETEPPTSNTQAAAASPAPTAAAPTIAETATTPPAEAASQPRIELAQADNIGEDALAAAGYINGQHYARLSPAQPTSSGPDQVEVAEFFMYSCIHCYNFEPYVVQWLQNKASYVNFIRVPTVWNAAVRMHAQAFYAAEALGKSEEMHTPFFREMHVNGNFLQSPAAIASFFEQFGVSGDDATSTMESFAVHTKVQRADELSRRYRVESTPTVVVNGKYRTNASMAGGYDQLIELINALAASEQTQN